jgi:aspartyl-tRNA(Asn)/glutamyl-tRNA(Gln) amidotransferase subunit C
MSDPITIEIFNHLVDLAALQLDTAESDYLRRQLNNQIKAIQELEAIPLQQDVPVAAHGVPYTAATSPAPREDTWLACPNPQDILAQVPELEEGYVVVPDIPHTTLE